MEQYIIRGGIPLHGEVEIGGAKNAALGILAAAIMTDDEVLIENLPDVRDVNVMLEAMSQIGVKIDRISPHAVMLSGADIGDDKGTGICCPFRTNEAVIRRYFV